MFVALAFVAGAIMLLELGSRWTTRWQESAIKQSGVFSYRRHAVVGGFSRPDASA